MILVIWQMVVPALGIYVLWNLLQHTYPVKKAVKGMIWALGITADSVCRGTFPVGCRFFSGPSDKSLPAELIPALVADRKDLLRQDALRSAF